MEARKGRCDMGFGFGFGMFEAMFGIVFVVIIGVFIMTAVKGLGQWNKNNHSPVLDVQARVVTKRADVSVHHHHDSDNMAMNHSTSSTTYYVTFEVQSGDRMELHVPDREYGMLIEGDSGTLTFQGTRYLGFKRA